MISAVIIEDNATALKYLSDLISDYTPQVQIIGTANSVEDGLALLNMVQPELVFLDVELHDLTAFDLLKQLPSIDFNIIFATGHTDYAIEAFKFEALHYIVKPIKAKDLIQAVHRGTEQKKPVKREKEDLLRAMEKIGLGRNKISLATQGAIRFVEAKNIMYLQAEGSYTNVFTTNGEKLMVSKNLKELAKQFNLEEFFRINKSYLVNTIHVSMIKRADGGSAVMQDGMEISISRNKRDEFYLKICGI